MPKVFSETKRSEIEKRLMETGLALIRQSGYRSMGIEAVTKRVGIAQGTFYSFFPSKEALVSQLAFVYQGRIEAEMQRLIAEKGGLRRGDLRNLYRRMFLEDDDNVYRFLTREDIQQLTARLPGGFSSGLGEARQQAEQNISRLIGGRKSIDIDAVLNWVQVINLTLENRDILVQSHVEKTVCGIIDAMLNELFEDETEGDL